MHSSEFDDVSWEYLRTFHCGFPTEEVSMSTEEMIKTMRRCIEAGEMFVSNFEKECSKLPSGSVLPFS